MTERNDAAPVTESAETFTPEHAETNQEELREYLECWRLPGGRLAPDQLRALLAWSGTPEEEKVGLRESLALTRQQVPTRSLAPDQRRGHVSWVERLKGIFRP